MKKRALAIWPQAAPKPKPEKPVLVKAENQWNHEEEVFRKEQAQRPEPGRGLDRMDLRRWIL